MPNIYSSEKIRLFDLLEGATNQNSGAKILIPDLQRPFVWKPSQVILLLDSLIRGWPFGTILMWKVAAHSMQCIPSRPFWKIVDRTKNADGVQVTPSDPPASYLMVLDGQQRIQSLLLAFGGDSWGFKLYDSEWALDLHNRTTHSSGKQHWSKGTLCFDLEMFGNRYSVTENRVQDIKFADVLQWVITDPVNGQSSFKKTPKYIDPLICADKYPGRFVQFNRIWQLADPQRQLSEREYRDKLKSMFAQEGICDEKIRDLLEPMGELMTMLSDVKRNCTVTYLELQPFDNSWTKDSYNDAIVNIFTRLNTAGRTLTREEITFAWLKTGWPEQLGTASNCFTKLLGEMSEYEASGVDIGIDSLVGAASFIWSIFGKEGRVLSDKDLLNGDIVRPMACELAEQWEAIHEAIIHGLKVLEDRNLSFGKNGQFSSLNSLSVIWAWLYIGVQWKKRHLGKVVECDNFDKQLAIILSGFVDRWLICSQWAGRWASSSAGALTNYSKGLRVCFMNCEHIQEPEKLFASLREVLHKFVQDMQEEAENFIKGLYVNKRERVSAYNSALWVWHRLEKNRWEKSSIPLRTTMKKKVSLQIDHIVSYHLFQKALAGVQPDMVEKTEPHINSLGNCLLLERDFNISKSNQSLRSFIEQINEIRSGTMTVDEFAHALHIDGLMLDAKTEELNSLNAAVASRDKIIRADLIKFIKGEVARVDV